MKRLCVAFLLVLSISGQCLGDIFRPSDITNLGLWLDAQDPNGTGQPLPDGTSISTWTDKSGLGNHATQGTIDRQPRYAVNGLNGRPSMRFDGTNDWFDVPPLFTLNAVTCFIVGQSLPKTLVGNEDNQPFISTSPTRFYIWRSPDTGELTFMFALGVGNHYEKHFSPGDNQPHTFAFQSNGMSNGVEGFVDGMSVGAGTKIDDARPERVQLGAFNSGQHVLDGYIAEVLIYNRSLSDTERIAVEGYLSDKWSSVPEPSSVALLASGGMFLISLAWIQRRRRAQ